MAITSDHKTRGHPFTKSVKVEPHNFSETQAQSDLSTPVSNLTIPSGRSLKATLSRIACACSIQPYQILVYSDALKPVNII